MTAEMIELALAEGGAVGDMLISVPHTELKTILLNRAAYHKDRAATKEAQIPALQSTLDNYNTAINKLTEVKASDGTVLHASKLSSSSGYNARHDANQEIEEEIKALRRDIGDHRSRAATFEFFANHLMARDYIIDMNTATHFELTRG